MKITKRQLKQIAKEEIGKVISESRRSYAFQDMIEDYAAELSSHTA